MNQPIKDQPDLLDQLLETHHPPNYDLNFNNSSELLSSNASYLIHGDPQDMPGIPKYLLKESNTLNSFKYEVNQSKDLNFSNIEENTFKKPIPLNDFDEAPVGRSNFNITETTPLQQQQNLDNLSTGDKICAKSVKTRILGFDQLLNIITTRNKYEFDLLIDKLQFSKFLKESNPGCFQKIISCYREAVFAGWIFSNEQELRQVIENGFSSSKPNIKKMGTELIELSFQQPSGPSLLESIIIDGLKGKNMKIVSSYITLLIQLLSTYGIKKMNYLKVYYAQIVKLINNQKNNTIKNDSMNLLKQAVKWVGVQLVLQYAGSLKDTLKKQLQKMWEQFDKTPMVPRKGTIQASITNNSLTRQQLNIYDIVDQVDVLKHFSEKWSDQVISTIKWNEKTALIQQMIDACNVPKIAPGQFRHIIEMCKRLIVDSNQNVVISILKLLGALAKGMRRNFYNSSKSMLPTVLLKFRQKKTQLLEQAGKCLDMFLLCFCLQEVTDDLKEGFNDKNPTMRFQLLEWFDRTLNKMLQQKNGGSPLSDKQKDGLKYYQSTIQKLISDGTSEVRQSARRVINSIGVLLDHKTELQVKVQSRSHSRQPSRQKRKSTQKDSKKKHNTNNVSILSQTSIQKSKHEHSESSILINNISGYRIDISNQLARLSTKLNDSDWEKRKAAIDELQDILDQHSSIHTNGIYDLFGLLKNRVVDANKQLARQSIHIAGKIVELAGKEAKVHARVIVNSLVDVLAEKNQSIRRQSVNTLLKIGKTVGMDVIFHPMSQNLQNQKVELRLEILKFLLSNDQFLNNVKDFLKGIVYCLCDKNRQIRSLSEKILQKTWEIVGMSAYRNVAKDKTAFTKQLTELFDKYEKKNSLLSRNNSVESKGYDSISKLTSPRTQINQPKNLPPSNKKAPSNPGLNKTLGTIPRYPSSGEIGVSNIKQQYDGEDIFAPLKTLTSNRIERSEEQDSRSLNYVNISQINLNELIQSMKANIRRDVVQKMISMDYQKVVEMGNMFSRLCKDLMSQSSFREVYDILLKWIYLRLWGGNQSVSIIFQIIPQILAILEKKNILVKDYEVEIILAIMREYFLSNQNVNKDVISLTLKCLVKVNVGTKVLKMLLRHFGQDVNSLHHHLRKDLNIRYRIFLVWIVKNSFMEYIQSQEILTEIVKIKEISGDEQFLQKIYSMFNESWLNEYGFKKINSQQPSILSTRSVQSTTLKQKQRISVMGDKKKSLSRIQSSGTLNKLNNNVSPRSVSKPSKNTSQQKILTPNDSSRFIKTPTSKTPSSIKIIPSKKQNHLDLPLNTYAWPNELNPIYEHLNNLCPASQSTCAFFETLFIQTSQKISNQLQMYSKVIIGSLLKGLIWSFEHRNEIHPEKIVQQAVLIQQAVKNKNIIRSCGDVLFVICDYLLNQLVEQDENKFTISQKLKQRSIDFSIQKFGKILNVCMLRILEFAEPNYLISILFQLLTKSVKNRFNSSQRLPPLILKCIHKMTPNYLSNIKQNALSELFRQFHNYDLAINEIDIENDEGSIKIKDLLTSITKQIKQKVWECYQRANITKDQFIIKHLKALNIARERIKSLQSSKDDELLKITQMLSKTKNYDTGIILLNNFMQKHPEFQITQYYLQQEYDHKFIARVLASLQSRQKRSARGGPQQIKNVGVGSSPYKGNQYLMHKVRSLKQRYEETESRNEIGRSRDKYSPREVMNANEIKKKVTEMGTKLGNAIRRC